MNGYNPYSQYPYTGYAYPNYGQRNYMQPQQPQMTQPQPQQPTAIQDIRFATSEEAKGFIVMPNSKVLLIDKNSGIAHLKTADNMGQSTTQYFKFEPVNADGTPIKEQENTPKVDYGQFATKKELETLVEQFKTMQKVIATINNPKSNEKAVGKGNTQANE